MTQRPTSRLPQTSGGTTTASTPGRSTVPASITSICFDLVEELFKLEQALVDVDVAVIRRTAELTHDATFSVLTNDRERRIFLDEYLDYDGLVEREKRLKVFIGQRVRLLAILNHDREATHVDSETGERIRTLQDIPESLITGESTPRRVDGMAQSVASW